ncbi:folliculin-interacting protein middle domain-containing protein [Phlyctochytrium arcticum]|nr:folliculin-interacting protein middle domain-containing protein [Phlyctochytrium arcticum]
MMFGAVPLTSRGVATKVHYFRAPNPQIMLSKVFTMSSEPNEEDEEAATQSLRTHSRLSSLSSSESTQWPDYPGNRNSQATPGSFYGSFTQSFQSDPYLSRNSYGRPVSWQNDTGKYGVSPASSMISTLSALTEGSGSYRRRKLERFSFQSAGRSGDSSMSSSPGSTSALKKPRRRISFGVGLILDCGGNSRLRDFFFTHFILIERHLIELQTIILSLILQNLRSRTPDVTGQGNFNLSGATVGPEFLDTLTWFPIPYALQLDLEMADAIQKFQDQVYALFAFPRLQEPLWLDMMSFPAKHKTVAETLVNDIKSLHATLDSPMNHFLAKALTVVLGQHLAWTGTVASLLGDKGAKSGTRLSKASASDPYNPYMAQINDLYGNIGLPPSASRTIIVGKDATKVKQMLRMLSYFIRCGELVEEVQHMLPNDIDNSNAAESELCPTYLEVPMPRTLIFRTIPDSNISEDQAPTRELHNFTYGRSLLGGYCPRYAADFALMGVPREPYLHALESDLKDLSEVWRALAIAIPKTKIMFRCLQPQRQQI